MMFSHRPLLASYFICLTSFVCLTGLGPVGPAAGQTPEPLKVQLQWTKNVESAPFFTAVEKGYFATEGLKTELMGGGPQIDPVALLASGAVDIAIVSSPLSVLTARSRGVPVVVIGAGFQKSPLGLAARADSTVDLPKGLSGARIGLQQVNRNLLGALLKANKVSESDVTTTVVTGDPTMLIEGKIDLMTVSVLNVPLAMEGRGVPAKTWLAYDLGIPMQGMIVAVLEKTLAERRKAVTGFMRAAGRGMEYNLAHSDEIAAVVVAKHGEGLNEAHQKAYNARQLPLMLSKITAQDGLFAIDLPTWQVANRVALESGLIREPANLSAVLNGDILTEAAMPKVAP